MSVSCYESLPLPNSVSLFFHLFIAFKLFLCFFPLWFVAVTQKTYQVKMIWWKTQLGRVIAVDCWNFNFCRACLSWIFFFVLFWLLKYAHPSPLTFKSCSLRLTWLWDTYFWGGDVSGEECGVSAAPRQRLPEVPSRLLAVPRSLLAATQLLFTVPGHIQPVLSLQLRHAELLRHGVHAGTLFYSGGPRTRGACPLGSIMGPSGWILQSW